MRRFLLMFLFIASAAHGAWWRAGVITDTPDIPHTSNANSDTYLRDGWQELAGSASLWVMDGGSPRLKTAQELADDAEAAAAAASNLAALATAPVEFSSGIAIPDSVSTNPVYEIGVENGALVTWVAHSSPHDLAVAESNRVTALAERSTLRHDLRVLKGVAQTNKAEVQAIVAWTNGMTAGQQRSDFNYLRRELIDANDSIIELTRLVRQLLKEQNP